MITNVIARLSSDNVIVRDRAVIVVEISRAIVQFNRVGDAVADGNKGDITVSGNDTNWAYLNLQRQLIQL